MGIVIPNFLIFVTNGFRYSKMNLPRPELAVVPSEMFIRFLKSGLIACPICEGKDKYEKAALQLTECERCGWKRNEPPKT